MKRIAVLLLVLLMLFTMSACGEKRILHCDGCGVECKVDADSNMTEDWLIYCKDCNNEIFADDPDMQIP
ncbi:MAG: hypothetical protein J6J43_02530 [Oscillospiraceae bacterium]|nr:hypothetical protein [Oscillospiraceae bacterium]